MEGQQQQQQRTSGRRRQRRRKKSKAKGPSEPILIAARRPGAPLLGNGLRPIVASAAPKSDHPAAGAAAHGEGGQPTVDGLANGHGTRRRIARIVRAAESEQSTDNRTQRLLERLVNSQGRGAISRAFDDLLECDVVPPKVQEVQIQLLEHEDERRAQDAVFAIAELLQREAPKQRPVLDQRLRRLEQSAEDPITRDAAGALRRSMRLHYGA